MRTYAVVLRHDNGRVTLRVGARDAREAKATVLSAENAPERAVLDVYRWFDTMTEVRQAVTASGSHWFDSMAMKHFRSRVSETLYGGRYFVSSEESLAGGRRYTVRTVTETESGFSIETVGEFQAYASRNGAHAAARKLARKP